MTILVTPSIKREIIDLAKQRLGSDEIARRVGCGIKSSYVSAIISNARRGGEKIPYILRGYNRREILKAELDARAQAPQPVAVPVIRGLYLSVDLDPQSLAYLRSEAAKRKVAAAILAGDILDAIDGIKADVATQASYLRRRIDRLGLVIEAARGVGYRLIVLDMPKWQPNIPPVTDDPGLMKMPS